MGRMQALIFAILLAIASIAGYLFLTEKIIAGRLKIAAGQKQIADGEQMLTNGKARLQSGKQRLSNAKNTYNGINSVPLMGIVSRLPVSGNILGIAKSKIDNGNKMVAAGSDKIRAGEKQLAEGKQDLQNGMSRLNRTNIIRMIFVAGAIVFTVLALVIGFGWKGPWAKKSKKSR